MYDFDTTTLDGGRTVHCEVFNAYSGITVISRDFKGPFKATRANAWGLRWAMRFDRIVKLSDAKQWADLKQAAQI